MRNIPGKGFYLMSDLFGHRGPPSWEILPAFGLRAGQHIPDEHLETTWMGVDKDGAITEIKLVSLSFAEAKALHPGSQKPRRVHAECPSCKRLVCAGHTTQHRCKA